VAEMDEKSFLAVELGLFLPLQALMVPSPKLNWQTLGACSVAESDIPLLSAITVDGDGDLWHTGLFGPVTGL
jgi:hypothetical protein